MLKRGETSEFVRELQDALIRAGYPLPKWGADGNLGSETMRALAACLTAHGRPFTETQKTVSERDIKLVFDLVDKLESAWYPEKLVDLRDVHSGAYRYGKRSWKEVMGITLHQTACVLGEDYNRRKKEKHGWLYVGAHVGIPRSGKIFWMSDFDWLVVHGGAFNDHDVGIEVDGMFAGIEGDRKTLWIPKDDPGRKAQSPTPAQLDSLAATIRFTVAEVARHGGKVKYLHAHRQAENDRQSDPGSAIWSQVAIPLMKELGLTDGPQGFKVGDGLPIPEAWDPRYKGIHY